MLRLLLIAADFVVDVDLVAAAVSEVEVFRLAVDLIAGLTVALVIVNLTMVLAIVNLITVLVIAALRRKVFLAVVDLANAVSRKKVLKVSSKLPTLIV